MNKPLGEKEQFKELVIKIRLGDACMDEYGVENVLSDISDEVVRSGTFAKSRYTSIDGNIVAEIEWR